MPINPSDPTTYVLGLPTTITTPSVTSAYSAPSSTVKIRNTGTTPVEVFVGAVGGAGAGIAILHDSEERFFTLGTVNQSLYFNSSGAGSVTVSTVTAVIQVSAFAVQRSMRVQAHGDSITAMGTAGYNAAGTALNPADKTCTINQWSGNYAIYGCALAGNARLVKSTGISGQTSAQIQARVGTDILAGALSKANVCVILAGTNDWEIGGVRDYRVTTANLQSMYQDCLINGIMPVAVTPPPRSDGLSDQAGNRAFLAQIRAWQKSYCASNGIPLVDIFTALNDGNGGYAAGYSTDGVHPSNPVGMQIAGAVLAATLQSVQAFGDVFLATSNTDPLLFGTQYPLNLKGGVFVNATTAGQCDAVRGHG